MDVKLRLAPFPQQLRSNSRDYTAYTSAVIYEVAHVPSVCLVPDSQGRVAQAKSGPFNQLGCCVAPEAGREGCVAYLSGCDRRRRRARSENFAIR
jgi:hypothetical protein